MIEYNKLFVYGSLLSGFFNYDKALEGNVLTCIRAKVQGVLFHQVRKGYPALIEGTDWVYGELLELTNFSRILPEIDVLENYYGMDFDNEYKRLLTQVFVEKENRWIKQKAFIYWYAKKDLGKPNNPVIRLSQGDWRSYMQESGKT